MSSVTATINGVELTEAQVRDALAQIDRAKRKAELPLKHPTGPEALAFINAARALGLPLLEVRAGGNYVRRGLWLASDTKWRIVRDNEGSDVLTWGDN